MLPSVGSNISECFLQNTAISSDKRVPMINEELWTRILCNRDVILSLTFARIFLPNSGLVG